MFKENLIQNLKNKFFNFTKLKNIYNVKDIYLNDKSSVVTIKSNDATIVFVPNVSLLWDNFKKMMPKGSIALDGFVKGKTIILDSENSNYLNFDHHEGNRNLIKCTCSQVFFFITTNLFKERFSQNNLSPTSYINHLDGDSVLSSYLVANYKKYEQDTNKNFPIKEIIDIEDSIDRSGGIYKGDLNNKYFLNLNWCLEPLEKDIPNDQKILEVFKRFEDFENGKAKELKPNYNFKFINQEYKNISESDYFHFITKESPFTRSYLYNQKSKDAFISLKEIHKLNNDTFYTYSIGKLRENSKFPIKDLINVFNKAEKYFQKNKISENNQWGANNIIGGSPYKTHSKIPPLALKTLADTYIRVTNDENNEKQLKKFEDNYIYPIIKASYKEI